MTTITMQKIPGKPSKALLGKLTACALSLPALSFAQAQPEDSELAQNQQAPAIEEIVTVGSARGATMQESTIAVTAIDEEALTKINTPGNISDVLRAVPGITIETSGNSDFNLLTRGFPQNFSPAGNIYVQLREDGLPILEQPLFVDPQYFSGGHGLRSVEAVRGSTAGIWGTNSPGALVNFVTKEGGPDTEGEFSVTTGPQGLFDLKSHISGPIERFDDTYYSFSANYVYDEGVRDRDYFPLNKGGEIFGNIIKEFDRGRVKFSAKWKDKIAHQTRPGLVSFSSDSGFSETPYYDIKEDNFVLNDFDRYSVPTQGGGTQERELSNGNHVDFYYVGGELEYDLTDTWKSTTKVRYTSGSVSTDIDINLFLTPVLDVAQSAMDQVGADSFRVETTFGPKEVWTEEQIRAGELGPDGLFSDDILIAWDWENDNFFLHQQFDHVTDRNSFSGAFYFSHFTRDRVGQFHRPFREAVGSPRTLDLIMIRDGEEFGATKNGFLQFNTNNRDEKSEQTVMAGIFEDEFQVTDKLDITASLRIEFKDVFENEARFEAVDLDGNPDTLYDNSFLQKSGEFVTLEDDFMNESWTLAANYQFTPDLGLFVRYSDLFLSRTIQDYTEKDSVSQVNEAVPDQNVDMTEIGFKYYADDFDVFATAFYAELEGIPFNRFEQNADGTIVETQTFGGSESYGLELTSSYRFSDRFSLDASFAYLDAEYVDTFVCCDADDLSIDVSGNQIIRQPEINFRLTPTFSITDNLEFYTAIQYFDERPGNEANTVFFDAYTNVDLGLTWRSDNGFYAKAQVINALDAEGQQEGSVQEGNQIGVNVQDQLTLGRFIPGVQGQLTLGYSF